jgi:hypothetical protein
VLEMELRGIFHGARRSARTPKNRIGSESMPTGKFSPYDAGSAYFVYMIYGV